MALVLATTTMTSTTPRSHSRGILLNSSSNQPPYYSLASTSTSTSSSSPRASPSPSLPEHLLLAAPSNNSLNSSASSTSSSVSTSGSGSWAHQRPYDAVYPLTMPSRRIRFAPLPDPRMDCDTLQESDDTAYTEENADDLSPADDKCASVTKATVTPASPLPPPPMLSSITLTPSVSIDSSHSSNTVTTLKSHTRGSGASTNKLLRPLAFLKRSPSPSPQQPLSAPATTNAISSTSSAPPSPYTTNTRLPRISAEDILTLGTIHLFRSSSRKEASTSAGSGSGWGKPLERWASTGSGSGLRLGRLSKRAEWPGSNLSRSSSIESNATTDSRRGRQLFAGSSSASSSLRSSPEDDRAARGTSGLTSKFKPGAGGGRHATAKARAPSKGRPVSAPSSPSTSPFALPPSASQPKGVRMLNGRVYGGKRRHTNANPFANVRDEPEFVEWGYGGMGSVQSGTGSEMWRGLQRGERGGALIGGGHGPAAQVKEDTAEVGKGVEPADEDGSGMGWVKRRREQREKEKREQEEKDKREREEKEKTAVQSPKEEEKTSLESTHTVIEETATPKDTQESADPHPQPQPQLPPQEHHILTAVRLSPHHRSHSQGSSVHHRTPSQSLGGTPTGIATPTQMPSEADAPPRVESPTHESSDGSPEDDEDNEDDGEGDEESESESEDHTAEDVRKTALGAGVEKISRHKDKDKDIGTPGLDER